MLADKVKEGLVLSRECIREQSKQQSLFTNRKTKYFSQVPAQYHE